MSTHPIHIAIIGGGLAGALVANGLLPLKNISFSIYESAPQFSERGAAVGLSENAQRALHLLLGEEATAKLFKGAGAMRMNSSRFMLGDGPQAGSFVTDSKQELETMVVHRAELLKELLKPIPKDCMFTNKRVTRIAQDAEASSVVIEFQDGTKAEADAVIGADGIHSFMRSQVLAGIDEKAIAPRSGHCWDTRALIPMSKFRERLGDEICDAQRQFGWIVDGGFIMHDSINNGELMHCVLAANTGTKAANPNQWKRPLSHEEIDTLFTDLDAAPKAVVQLMKESGDLTAFSEWESAKCSTFFKGRVAIMGDAAHAPQPWQGSGAAMAVEDAMVLAALFAQCQGGDEVPAVFAAYDSVRRPRSQRVVESSRETGWMMAGVHPETKRDLAALQERLMPRWDFILYADLGAHREEALQAFELRNGRTRS